MKIKLLIIAVFILIFTIISFGQDNKTTKLGKNDNTKKIIKPASKIPSKPLSKISLVFLDLVNETSRGDYKYLSENIPNITKNAFLRKRNYPIVPTEKTQDVINDKNIKPNELNNAEKALEIGKTVKADMVIFGKYKVTNGNINISLKVVDTRDGKVFIEYEKEDRIGKGTFKILDGFVEDNYAKLDRKLGLKKLEKKPTSRIVKEEISIHTGFISAVSRIDSNANIGFPYVSIGYKPEFLKISDNILFELEFAFFKMKSNDNASNIKSQFTGFLPTISLVTPVKISEWYTLSPKLGVGIIFQSAKREITAVPSTLQQVDNNSSIVRGLAKLGLQNELKLSDSLKLLFNVEMLWQFDPNGMITYITSNLGLAYEFEREVIYRDDKNEVGLYLGILGTLTKRIDNQLRNPGPFLSVYYRPSYLSFADLFYLELELMLFSFKSRDEYNWPIYQQYAQKEFTAFSPLISMAFPIRIAKWYHIVPKLGGGITIQKAKGQDSLWVNSLLPNLEQFDEPSGTTIDAMLRLGLHNEILFGKSFKLLLSSNLLFQFNKKGTITYLTLHPGVGYSF